MKEDISGLSCLFEMQFEHGNENYKLMKLKNIEEIEKQTGKMDLFKLNTIVKNDVFRLTIIHNVSKLIILEKRSKNTNGICPQHF